MNNAECPFEEKVFLYIDGELSQEEIPAVEAHLKECSSCAEQLALMKTLSEDFHEDVPIPADFTRRVMQKVDAPAPALAFWPALGAAAFFLVVFFFVPSSNPMPAIGDMLARLFQVFKNLPFSRLGGELVRQNAAFLVSYVLMIMMMTVYFMTRKRHLPNNVSGLMI